MCTWVLSRCLKMVSQTWHWQNHVQTHQLVCLDIQTLQLLKGGID